jgi:autotransporter-associated beta strand protein
LEPGFPADIRIAAKARGEAAIAALGARLPEVAAFYGKSPLQLREVFRADRSLWVDPEGQLLYACEFECAHCGHEAAEAEAEIAETGPTDPAPFDTAGAFLLHSRPGANRVIYLDFDGHIDNTPGNWKDGASSPPYNISGDPADFSTDERNRIIEIWQRVSEDFSIYQIDVTTEEPPIEALRKTSSSDATYGIRVCIGGSGNDWYGNNVGGVAFVGSFDTNQDVPCWVFTAGTGNGAKNIAEATSHEVGHSLGLLHDGVEGGAGYYSGHGNWAPIMGASYTRTISQWSKGEYTNPNNTQDDLAVMLTQGAVYRSDDHGNSVATATSLSADSDSAIVNGVIERNTDLDFFRINAVTGSMVINAKPTPLGPNLRLEVKLYDSGGVLLQTATSADVSGGTGGTQPVALTRSVTAGVFYISVDGIGNGVPTTGYSDYASIGQYKATVTGVAPGGFTWTSVTAGNKQWNTAGNWASATVPNAAAITVRVNNDITGDQTIQLASAYTLGAFSLGDSNSTHAFTFASSGGSLVFNNSGNAATLSKTSGGNDIISAPVSLMDNLLLTQSAPGTLAFSGGISGAKSLTKAGAGTVVLASPNIYTGRTTLDDGLLRLDNSSGLPGGIDNAVGAGESTLAFEGGVLGLLGDFTRQMGTAAGQLDWVNGSGGFAAFGADREVRLNNGTGAFSWASTILGSGNSLILGHPTATHTLIFRNGISFAETKRTVKVDDGAAAVDAILSGVLSGGGGFSKTGSGVLSLTNTNTHTGVTTVADGVLRLQNANALPSGNLELTGGGVLGLGSADLSTRTIGTGVDQVKWLGSGGFAAFGANRAVRFTADLNTSINWNATNFIGSGRVLILGHDTADATLDWQQRISLAGNLRIVQVDDGSAAIDAKMSGVIAGGTSGTVVNIFSKSGAGTLAFTAQNTYWGETIIGAGTLMIGDGGTVGGISQNTLNIIVEAGAILAANRSNTLTQGSSAFKAAITGDGGFTQAGSGNTVLALANTYIGPTTLGNGTLTLGAAGVLPDASEVSVGNATLVTGSFSETAGRLVITGAAAINFGSGAALSFANSTAVDWSGGTLQLTGDFVSGSSLRFGSNDSGLTPSQLGLVSAEGFSGFGLNASGYLVANATFSAWITRTFSNGAIPTDKRGPHDDFDNDGVPNLLENAIEGQDPTVPGPSIGSFTGNTLSFTKRAGTSGLSYAIQQSTDLGVAHSWTEVTGASYVNDSNTVSYSLPVGGSGRVFLRLQVLSE